MSVYRVTGYKAVVGDTTLFYIADTLGEVTSAVMSEPVESGGYVRHTVEEIGELPPEAHISCPHCDTPFADPRTVITLSSTPEGL
jgi:hypothetical protein